MIEATAKIVIAWVASWVGAELQSSVLQMQVSTDDFVVQASSFAPAAVATDNAMHEYVGVPLVTTLAHLSRVVVAQSVDVFRSPVELVPW